MQVGSLALKTSSVTNRPMPIAIGLPQMNAQMTLISISINFFYSRTEVTWPHLCLQV